MEAFKLYDEGSTMTEIRNILNERGVRNPKGLPLNYGNIQHMLSNRRYIGEYQYRDIIIPDGIPALVPKDLFDRVQQKLAKNKKAPARHKAEDDYLLTTKLFCGYCGAYLCGESGTSRTGAVHHYYKCSSVKKKRKECHKKPIRLPQVTPELEAAKEDLEIKIANEKISKPKISKEFMTFWLHRFRKKDAQNKYGNGSDLDWGTTPQLAK